MTETNRFKHDTSPYERPWDWDERDQTDIALVRAIEALGPDVPVRASPSALASAST